MASLSDTEDSVKCWDQRTHSDIIKNALSLLDHPEPFFRGQIRRHGEKVKQDGTPLPSEWAYGGIFPGDGDFSIIYTRDPVAKKVVYTNTVGQYIGKRDKNNTRIFTGDIVQYNGNRYLVCFFFCGFVLVGNFGIRNPGKYLSENLEVVGNKHDNPQLAQIALYGVTYAVYGKDCEHGKHANQIQRDNGDVYEENQNHC